MRNALSIIIIIALVAVGGWYYHAAIRAARVPQANNLIATGSEAATTTIRTDAGTTTDTGTGFVVTGYNFGFSPSSITARKGDHVKIEFDNQGGVHDLVISELNVRSARIDTGATTSVEFDASLAGTFTYYSSAGNDRANGMWGTLTVTP